MSIRLSEKHGANPAIPVCFFCGKEKTEIILAGRLKGDVEAPKMAVWNMVPCDECKKLMDLGVLLISVKGDHRKCKCECGNEWDAPVHLSDVTQNLSGEASNYCPKCGKKASYCSSVIKEDQQNPHRTGRMVVIKAEVAQRIFTNIGNSRVAFIEDEAWAKLGLPMKEESNEQKENG